MKRALLLLVLLGAVPPSMAHELLSVSLQLEELAPGEVQVMLKTPVARDGSPAAVVLQLQPECTHMGIARAERGEDLILRQWRLHCAGGLANRSLQLQGLDPRTPDAVIVARFSDGSVLTQAVDRHDPVLVLRPPALQSRPAVMAYLPIGIEHILLGPDHLLFVLGLMLVVYAGGRGGRMLVAALTAFTLAHSLTLALAVLGIWGLPPKAVEVLIAMSIVLLAVELASYEDRGARGLPPSLTLRMPWLVAFAFGLLHGFGFAGALLDVGLPEQARGWALFLFNLGVEIGQLLFVAAALAVLMLVTRLRRQSPASMTPLLVTLLGSIAMFWTLDRVWQWSRGLGVA